MTEELKKSFRPEFINRIDEVIVFRSLTQEDVKNIVDLMMRRVREQLKAKDVEIELTDAARVVLATEGYDQSLGARPLRHDPAARRGPARRAPVQGVPRRRDDPRRRRRWRIVFDHTGGMLPPDVPPVEARRFTRVIHVGSGEPDPSPPPSGGIKAEARTPAGPGLLSIGNSSKARSHRPHQVVERCSSTERLEAQGPGRTPPRSVGSGGLAGDWMASMNRRWGRFAHAR